MNKKRVAVAFVCSEIYPYAKTGGLADVCGTLPRYLKEHVDIVSVMPLYKSIDIKKYKITATGSHFEIVLNQRRYPFVVYATPGRDVYFLQNPELFDREYLYGTPSGEYGDNDIRFGLFCHAAIELFDHIDFKPDIFHLNDWQSALIPLLLKEKYKSPAKSLLTIHNLAYQGVFHKDAMWELGLDWSTFTMERIEFFDQVNFLKAGIAYSDAITTVSPTYAQEILQPEFGCMLDSFLLSNRHKLTGILNGIDEEIWNPKTDKKIAKRFSASTLPNKKENKKALLKRTGLNGIQKPLFAFIGRFVDQKGIGLLASSLEVLQSLNINVAILGEGDERYNRYFSHIKGLYTNIFVHVGYDEELSRNIYAAADFLMMPSFFEPCGLGQMIAMRYGAMPIVRKTGGLADTVKDFSLQENDARGKGVVFEGRGGQDFLVAIARALSLYADRKKFAKMVKENMQLDFSWNASAKRYLELYQHLGGIA